MDSPDVRGIRLGTYDSTLPASDFEQIVVLAENVFDGD